MTETPPPADGETPLERRLIELIRASGPISIADYMADCLGHPQHGYYMKQAPFGAQGDFTTAPEVSQMFGELIGAWLLDSWRAMGEPGRVNLIELGPGRGVLMADILRTAKLRPAFLQALQVHLVETSGRLRFEQERRLRDAPVKPAWLDDLSEAPEGPTLIVANEFFDCMPIRQYERGKAAWRERLVGLDRTGERLALMLSGVNTEPEDAPGWLETAAPGDVYETSRDARELAELICEIFAHDIGRALIIDYGHARSGFGDTLQAVKAHAYWPPLATPGEADLTAHVDFGALARVALDNGASAFGPIPQGVFLRRLGLIERAAQLKQAADAEQAGNIDAAVRRLASEDQMGTIFKAFCLSSPRLSIPPGFDRL